MLTNFQQDRSQPDLVPVDVAALEAKYGKGNVVRLGPNNYQRYTAEGGLQPITEGPIWRNTSIGTGQQGMALFDPKTNAFVPGSALKAWYDRKVNAGQTGGEGNDASTGGYWARVGQEQPGAVAMNGSKEDPVLNIGGATVMALGGGLAGAGLFGEGGLTSLLTSSGLSPEQAATISSASEAGGTANSAANFWDGATASSRGVTDVPIGEAGVDLPPAAEAPPPSLPPAAAAPPPMQTGTPGVGDGGAMDQFGAQANPNGGPQTIYSNAPDPGIIEGPLGLPAGSLAGVGPSALIALSSLLGAGSASRAADAQRAGTAGAQSELARQFDLNRADLAPARNAGNVALSSLTAGTTTDATGAGTGSLNKPFSISDFWNDPVVKASYDAGLELGTKALKNRAPLTTGLDSGAGLKELTKFGTDYTGNMAAGSHDRFEADKTNQFNRLAAVAGIGQNATNMGVNAGTTTSTNVANLTANQGNNDAAARIATGNAFSNGLSSIANWWQSQDTLNRLGRAGVNMIGIPSLTSSFGAR